MRLAGCFLFAFCWFVVVVVVNRLFFVERAVAIAGLTSMIMELRGGARAVAQAFITRDRETPTARKRKPSEDGVVHPERPEYYNGRSMHLGPTAGL